MTLSSALSSIQAPDKYVNNAELEIPNSPIKVILKTKRTLTKILGGGPCNRNAQAVVLIKRVIFPIAIVDEEIASLPKLVGRGKIENHQRSTRAPRKIEEALRGFLRAKKIKEQSYTGNTKSPVPKENQ